MRQFRSLLAGFLLLLPVLSATQVWEKLITPGLNYRMEVDLKRPLVVHVLRFAPGAEGVIAKPALGQGKVYEPDETKGREVVSGIVQREQAIAGINGDFFPWTGKPEGVMVRDGELLSSPMAIRTAFGWGPFGSFLGRVDWNARLKAPGGVDLRITGLNEELGGEGLVANLPVAGIARAKVPNAYLVLRSAGAKLSPGKVIQAEVAAFFVDQPEVPIGDDEIVVAATGANVARIAQLKIGTQATLQIDLTGVKWSAGMEMVSGGPQLVRDGKVQITAEQERFNDAFAKKAHPRTAVGLTADGETLWVAVDGRQEMSAGLTLAELAALMVRLGCVEAVNLDGGGSTTLNLFGLTMNRPSDGRERPVANAIVFVGKTGEPDEREMAIQGAARLGTGERSAYRVVGDDGLAVPNAEVLWSASGSAWIDQGGNLRGLREGPATITAFVRGRFLTIPVTVSPPPK